MKKTWIWIILMVGLIGGLVFLATTETFLTFAGEYPLLSSFIKFFILASIGDIIGYSIRKKEWVLPPNIGLKALVWGLIGIVIYLMFQIFPYGVYLLQLEGVLPFVGSPFAKAFLISLLINSTFAPTMMSVHRISDTYLNERAIGNKPSVIDTINNIDWGHFYQFILFRTIPFFWIPAHTITFLLPEEYRVLFAAILGIVLGVLLGFGEKRKG